MPPASPAIRIPPDRANKTLELTGPLPRGHAATNHMLKADSDDASVGGEGKWAVVPTRTAVVESHRDSTALSVVEHVGRLPAAQNQQAVHIPTESRGSSVLDLGMLARLTRVMLYKSIGCVKQY